MEENWDNEEFVINAMKEYGTPYAIYHASPRLKSDKEFLLEAIRNNTDHETVLEYANSDVTTDLDFILEAVKIHGEEIIGASMSLREANIRPYREIIEESLKNTARDIFPFLENWGRFQDDKRLVLLELGSERLQPFTTLSVDAFREDPQVALAMIKKRLRGITGELWSDPEFMLEAIKIDSDTRSHQEDYTSAHFIREYFGNDSEFLLEAIELNPFYVKCINNEQLSKDENFLLEIINSNVAVLEYLGEDVTNNYDLMLKAIALNEDAQKYLGEDLKDNSDFIQKVEIAKQDVEYKQQLAQEIQQASLSRREQQQQQLQEEKKLLLEGKLQLKDANPRLQIDEELLLDMMRRGIKLEGLRERFAASPEFIKKAEEIIGEFEAEEYRSYFLNETETLEEHLDRDFKSVKDVKETERGIQTLLQQKDEELTVLAVEDAELDKKIEQAKALEEEYKAQLPEEEQNKDNMQQGDE